MDQPAQILILAGSDGDSARFRELLSPAAYGVREQRADLAQGVIPELPDTDATVVCLPPDFMPPRGESGQALRRKPVLYVAEAPGPAVRHWVCTQAAAELLVYPLTGEELGYALAAQLAADPGRLQARERESSRLAFLKELLEGGHTALDPVIDTLSPWGYSYPPVTAWLGRYTQSIPYLEQFASDGLLARKIVNRLRRCPECGHSHLNYRETCPKCSHIDIVRETMIHHFACALIAPLSEFQKGSDLVCPKCSATLRHIGLDYEKPSGYFSCQDCAFTFQEPRVDVQCLRCTTTSDPAHTREQPVYRYEITPLVREAVEEGRISGIDLGALLRSQQTGLYTRQYFEHELERELVRAGRYKAPFAVLMVRLDHFEKIRALQPAQAAHYANSVFAALSERLRTLDTTCVWNTDTLGVLLTNTPRDGAEIVARRMQENVHGLEYLYAIQAPSVTISLITGDEGYDTGAAITEAAMRDLDG